MTSFLLGLIFICFANEEAVSRWFCSSSIPNVVVSTVFVRGGLGCAFLADQALSASPGLAGSGFAPFSGLFTQAVI